ncbi:MAG: hypothetical protein HC886_03395 [Leptolyngbyaceae cyanobacterium SM1_1_3]|nr:hypothetical protein [Leptolyngbyaceae cyanobacterium SM1_1_3]
MTSQQNQIQQLIAEIDAVLGKASPRLPWVISNETSQQRRVLERIRGYLSVLEAPVSQETHLTETSQRVPAASENSAQQVLQALLQEMGYLRTQMLQPMRMEVDALQQQRDRLLQEVRLLDIERLRGTEDRELKPPVADFLRALIEQMQETLAQQLSQTVQQIPNSDRLLARSSPAAAELLNASSSQQLAQLQRLQEQSDQLLLKLDSTLTTVFEALQSSITSYQESLSQGLGKMHSLGQQGEVIFSALINHLAQQLSQEASAYLSAEARSPELQTRLLTSQSIPEAAEVDDSASAITTESAVDEAELSLDLESLDLDFDFEEDEDITLLQIGEEITQLQLDQPNDQLDSEPDEELDDEDRTLIQGTVADSFATSEPDLLELLAPLERDADTTAPGEYRNDIDTLYESLFGLEDVTLTNADAQALATAESAQSWMDTVDDVDAVEPELDFENLDVAIVATNRSASAASINENEDEDEAIAQAQTQALDALLLGELAVPAEIPPAAMTLESFFEGAESEHQSQEPDSIPETIASLSDLLPDHRATHSRATEELLEKLDGELSLSTDALAEDTYIPAPANEDLLVDAEPAENVELSLDLDSAVLEQLSADLSSLEGLEPDILSDFASFERDRAAEPASETSDDTDPLMNDLAGLLDEAGSAESAAAIDTSTEISAGTPAALNSSILSDWDILADELEFGNGDEAEETGATLQDLTGTEALIDSAEETSTAATLSLEMLEGLNLENINSSSLTADLSADSDDITTNAGTLRPEPNLEGSGPVADESDEFLDALGNLSFEDLLTETARPEALPQESSQDILSSLENLSRAEPEALSGSPNPTEERSVSELETDFSIDLPDDLEISWDTEASLGAADPAEPPSLPDSKTDIELPSADNLSATADETNWE